MLGVGLGPAFAGRVASEPDTLVGIMGANIVALWDADEAASITTTGSGVSEWEDLVSGYVLAQAIDAARPVWAADSFNGLGGVTGDGVDDFLRILVQPGGLPTGAAYCELWWVGDQKVLAADTASKGVFNYGGVSGASAARRILRQVSGGVNRAQMSTGGTSPNNPNVDFSGRHYVRAMFGDGAIRLDVDGVAGTAGAPTMNTDAQHVTLFASHAIAAASFHNATVNKAFILDAAPDAGQLARLNALCAGLL